MRKRYRVLRGVAALGSVLLLLGCVGDETVKGFDPGPGEMANVTVYLANESQERGSVTLALYVDGRLAASRVLGPDSVHAPEGIPLRLLRGEHTLRVVAIGQRASKSTEICVRAGPLYVSARYGYDSGRFDGQPVPEEIVIDVQNEPFGFC
jgi:hypothetical protein